MPLRARNSASLDLDYSKERGWDLNPKPKLQRYINNTLVKILE